MASEFQKKKYSRYFELCDFNNDGMLTEDDYVGQVNRLAEIRGLSLDDPKVESERNDMRSWWEQLKGAADANQDGKVSKEEFVNFWGGLVTLAEAGTPQSAGIREQMRQSAISSFVLLDNDEDGKVILKEHSDYINSFNSDIDVKESFQKLSLGKDFLTQDDVVEIVLQFIFSDNPEDRGTNLYGVLS